MKWDFHGSFLRCTTNRLPHLKADDGHSLLILHKYILLWRKNINKLQESSWNIQQGEQDIPGTEMQHLLSQTCLN